MRSLIFSIALFGYCIAAFADEFRDFRVPTNSVSRANVSFSGWLARHRNNSESPNSGQYTSTQIEHWGNGSILYEHVSDSDPLLLWAYFRAGVNEQLASNEADWAEQHSESSSYELGSFANAEALTRWFPNSGQLGIQIRPRASVNYDQDAREDESASYHQHDSSTYVQKLRNENWGSSTSFSVSGGPSIGRIRNVTPIVDARVLEKRLMDEGALSGPLSGETFKEVTNLLYKKPLYRYLHSRTDRFFWRDIEKIVEHDPAFNGPLSAYVTNRIAEQYFGSIYRGYGFSFAPNISYYHSRSISHSWRRSVYSVTPEIYPADVYEIYYRNDRFSDTWSLTTSLSYRRPFGTAWQFDASSAWGYEVNDNNPDVKRTRYNGHSTAELHYQIADRLHASSELTVFTNIERTRGFYQTNYDTWSGELAMHVGYFVEDNLQLTANISNGYNWNSNRGPYGANKSDQMNTVIYVGFDYSLFGALTSSMLGPTSY